jgi:IclR family acetate operon transcriptional repressor
MNEAKTSQIRATAAPAVESTRDTDRADNYGSSTVDKALDVLTAVAGATDGVTNLDVSRLLGLDKSTSHRLLTTLERKRFIRRAGDSRRYTLGPFISFLAANAYMKWTTLLTPALHELVELTGESASFSLRHGDQFLCLDAVPSLHELRYCPKTGNSYPLNAGASGKAILAFLPDDEIERILATSPLEAFTDRTITKRTELMHEIARIRAQGYATSAGERVVGGCAIAAPVTDAGGEVIGALAISAVDARCPLPRLHEFRKDLYVGAQRLSDSNRPAPATGEIPNSYVGPSARRATARVLTADGTDAGGTDHRGARRSRRERG